MKTILNIKNHIIIRLFLSYCHLWYIHIYKLLRGNGHKNMFKLDYFIRNCNKMVIGQFDTFHYTFTYSFSFYV